MKRLALFLSLWASTLQGDLDTNRILFLLHRGETADAIDLYRKSIDENKHDHEAIEQMCQLILEQGFRDPDPEIQMLTLFGAGIAANEKALHILEEAIQSPTPPIQLAALNLLAKAQNDGFDESLRYLLRSPYLILRLEALFKLAENKNPRTAAYAESLMALVPEDLFPVFPEIFAETGDGASNRMLKRMIAYPQENVRVATILTLAKHQRDDFLPKIRTLATHHSPKQLEACAYALGVLKDESSIARLQQLTTSTHENVRLAALIALYNMGRKEALKPIEEMALQEDLFAIAALESINGTEPTLIQLVISPNPHVRINACLGLLAKKDVRCLKALAEVLLKDNRDYAFTRINSKAHSASAWKVVSCAQQRTEDIPSLHEQSLMLKASVLCKAIEFDEKTFLQIAEGILNSSQNDLVPPLMTLLENKQTPDTILLLKRYQQKVGVPLIRQYCNLVLFKLKESEPYEGLIKEWILSNMHESLFYFKPTGDIKNREVGSTFNLTPDETSKLLIESIEVLARAQNDLSIDILLDLIKRGHNKNKYALAGLLMRVAQ